MSDLNLTAILCKGKGVRMNLDRDAYQNVPKAGRDGPNSPFKYPCHLLGLMGEKIFNISGSFGFSGLMAAKAFGASEVIITGKRRLELARQLGADYTVKVTGKEDAKELANKIEGTMGDQPDITIDCVGTTETVQLAVHATKPGGCVALVGMTADNSASIGGYRVG